MGNHFIPFNDGSLYSAALLGLVTGRPQTGSEGLQDSISSVLRTLSEAEDRPRTRPRIITKYDFMQTRDKKSHLDLPPEFVISTEFQVSHQDRNPQVKTAFLP